MQHKKRILIFSLAYYPQVGGAEIAIKEITDRILDIEFQMITHNFGGQQPREEKIGNVFVHRIGAGSSRLSKFLFQFSAAVAAARLHRREKFDAAWAIMAHSAGVPATLFSFAYPRVPFLLTLQEGDPPEYIEHTMRPLWPLFRRAFTHAAAVQAISTYLADWAKRMGATTPIEIIGNGVDVARFARPFTPDEIAEMKKKLGKQRGDIFLVTASRLVRKNALDDVIRALPLLPQAVSFLIYGAGPEKEKLKKHANELQVGDRVRFLGQIRHEELPRALSAYDIFIRPSRSEGMGNAFLEAMAAGLPIIATQEGGIRDFLFDAKRNPGKPATGFAVDKDSPEEIAEAVKYVMSNSEEKRQTIENARALVRGKYDWNIIVRQIRALFATIGI